VKSSEDKIEELMGMISDVTKLKGDVAKLNDMAESSLKDMADENEKLKEQRKYITYDCIVLSSLIYIHLYVVKSAEDEIKKARLSTRTLDDITLFFLTRK